MNPSIRVCIMHDHRLFFDAVKTLLHRLDAFTVIHPSVEATGFEPELSGSRCSSFDIALVDAMMDTPDAIAATRECKQRFPSAKVIIVGLAPSENVILQAIEAGANGYTIKDATPSELIYTIQAVHSGQTPCTPRIAALVFARIAELAQEHSRCPSEQAIRVTPREREILQLLATGCHNAEIAHRLGITLHTVKNHVHHILDKFQVRGRREVIQRAYEHGMLTGPSPLRIPLTQSRYSWV